VHQDYPNFKTSMAGKMILTYCPHSAQHRDSCRLTREHVMLRIRVLSCKLNTAGLQNLLSDLLKAAWWIQDVSSQSYYLSKTGYCLQTNHFQRTASPTNFELGYAVVICSVSALQYVHRQVLKSHACISNMKCRYRKSAYMRSCGER
jgi:hypothetical protein